MNDDIQKVNLTVNFNGDLDLKTDPFQVGPQNFLAFNNAVRTTGGRMTKRNGYQLLASFSSPYATSLAVLNGALVGLGNTLQVYEPDTSAFYNRGYFQPLSLSVLPAIRNSAAQTSSDMAIASNGLACVVCADSQAGVVYQILDSATGNVIVPITAISGASVARVFILGTYFLITYYNGSGIVYKAIPWASPTTSPTSGAIISTSNGSAYDAFSSSGYLFIAYNSTNLSNHEIAIATLSSSLSLGSNVEAYNASLVPHQISITVDATDPNAGGQLAVWLTFSNYTSPNTHAYAVAFQWSSGTFTNYVSQETIYAYDGADSLYGITSVAQGGLYYGYVGAEASSVYSLGVNAYGTGSAAWTGFSSLTPGLNLVLAGKPAIVDGIPWLLAFFPDTYQPTYFLITAFGVIGKLAYSNGGLPDPTVLSSPTVVGTAEGTVQWAYLYQDLLVPVNKGNGASPGGLYEQAGCNICTWTFNQSTIVSSSIAGSLQASGGYLWMYDGQATVEQNFHLWPTALTASVSSSGGSIAAANQPYYYVAVYEWTDGAGNIHRSAPSIPLEVTGMSGSDNTITLTVPCLTQTWKISPNPIRIVIYRWSTAQQEYYQVSSVTNSEATDNALLINVPGNSDVTFVDVLADSSIDGNTLLYTTGGVVEDIGGPASDIMALFDDRLWLVDAEDPNLMWFSKQVIEDTPVEMSDLLTYYVAPTISSQASTGQITALGAMDDKLIIFKAQAIYYINGTGPDNTGANSQYSQPIFITAAVGCTNPQSVVLTPGGLMFQTSEGFWLLGRDLSTKYIGAPVESYNSQTATSAVSIPSTTQIRFTLGNGTELIYDYFYEKWDTATPPTAISGVIYDGLHTILDSSGNLWQEDPGSYVDGSSPVNQSFTTPWYNLAGLQGFERAYYFYLLGTYLSPHSLTVQIYYDYATSPSQTVTVNPNSSNPNGNASGSLEQFRIFFKQQKCQAVKFVVTEAFDSSFGGTAGAGVTLSGINFVLGIKKPYRPIPAAQSAG